MPKYLDNNANTQLGLLQVTRGSMTNNNYYNTLVKQVLFQVIPITSIIP